MKQQPILITRWLNRQMKSQNRGLFVIIWLGVLSLLMGSAYAIEPPKLNLAGG